MEGQKIHGGNGPCGQQNDLSKYNVHSSLNGVLMTHDHKKLQMITNDIRI